MSHDVRVAKPPCATRREWLAPIAKGCGIGDVGDFSRYSSAHVILPVRFLFYFVHFNIIAAGAQPFVQVGLLLQAGDRIDLGDLNK